MKFLGTLSLALGAAILAGCGGGGGAAGAGGTVANINGTDVSREDYVKRMETLQSVNVRINGQVVKAELAEPVSSQALRSLIEEQVILQLAKDESVAPTEKEVDARKDLQEKITPDFLTRLKEQGWRMDDINKSLQVALAREGLASKGVPEQTLKDVDDWLKANPASHTKPAQASFRFIRVDSDKTGAVDSALQGGQPFAAVAAKYSKEPNAVNNNGAFPPGANDPQPVVVDSLIPQIRDLVKATGERKTSPWIASGNEKLKIFVESKIAESVMEPTAAQKELIRVQLRVQRGSQVNNLEKKLYQKIVSAKIDVGLDYLKKVWDQYFQQLKQRGETLYGTEGSASGQAQSGGGGGAKKSDGK